MDTLLVGFGCKARNGKDTLAKHVHELMPSETEVFGFADDLKALARSLGMKGKNAPFLQDLGVAMRTLNPQCWIEQLQDRIEIARPKVALVVDVRFENEARWIASNGGLLYRVDRIMPAWEDADGKGFSHQYISTDRSRTHVSETDLDGKDLFDEYIQIADGDMQAFREHAVRISYKIVDKLNRRTGNVVSYIPQSWGPRPPADPNMPKTATGMARTGAISALGVDLPDDIVFHEDEDDDPGVAM